MRSLSPLMVAAALLFVPALSHAQLTNGGFEPAAPAAYALLVGGSTAIPGWTTTDNGTEWFPPTAYGYLNSPNGGHIVDLACYTYSAGGVKLLRQCHHGRLTGERRLHCLLAPTQTRTTVDGQGGRL